MITTANLHAHLAELATPGRSFARLETELASGEVAEAQRKGFDLLNALQFGLANFEKGVARSSLSGPAPGHGPGLYELSRLDDEWLEAGLSNRHNALEFLDLMIGKFRQQIAMDIDTSSLPEPQATAMRDAVQADVIAHYDALFGGQLTREQTRELIDGVQAANLRYVALMEKTRDAVAASEGGADCYNLICRVFSALVDESNTALRVISLIKRDAGIPIQ